ncbi:MAG: PKD domain-containing protein [Solirubrobacterales bacterium]
MLRRLLQHGLLIAAGGAMASLAWPWPAVAGADAAQVTVVSPGGVQRPLSLEALAGSENVREQTYLVRSPSGEESRRLTGFSLAAVLDAAGADPFSFSHLEVQRPVGGSVLLSRHQALDPGAFAEGLPLVYATANGTGFLRPASDAGDANGGDCFEAPQGITIVLRKGSPLRVRASASKLRVRTGQRVEFSVAVDGAGAGEQLEYSWYFDDGDSATGPSASHSFAKRGSYDVVVGVTTEGDDAGASAVVAVQVGTPGEGGPDRRGGGDNRDAAAPDSGAARGAGGPATTAGPTESSGTGAAAPPPPKAPARSGDSASTPEGEGTPRRPAGDEVSGVVISESADAEAQPEASAEPAAARTGSLDESDGGDGGLPTAAWGILAGLGLLGTGALIEAGGVASLAARFGR